MKINNVVKAYPSFSEELKQVFGCKVQRISVDPGFTCPNRDGTIGTGGCIFCGGHGSGSYGIKRELSVTEQLNDGKDVMRRKYKALKFIAYFQAYTTTNTSPKKLRILLDEALKVEDIVGIIIATRPDCLSDEMLDLIAEYASITYLWLEIGMQSMHNRSLSYLNRCHNHASTISAVKRSKMRGIKICVHLIIGLPEESKEDLMATVSEINRLLVDGVKIHLLHVIKETVLEKLYNAGSVVILDRDEYAGLVCDVLEKLDPQILIHRLTGDGGHDNLVAPLWSLKKFEVLNLIDAEMARRKGAQNAAVSLSCC